MYLLHGVHLRYPSNFSTVESLSWNAFFRSIGEGFLGVFVPIYIFILGGGQTQFSRGLVTTGLFILIMRACVAIFSIPAARLIKKMGYRRSILLGTVAEAAFFLMLIFADRFQPLLWWSALVMALYIVFYWIPRLSLISADSLSERMGRSLGVLELVSRGSGVLGPFVGSIIATMFGFQALFAIGLVILLISAIPMWFMPPHNHLEKPSLLGFCRWVSKKRHRGLIAGFLGRSADDQVAAWLWPLYVFLFVGNLELFGGLTSAVLLIGMVAILSASLLFDHHRLGLARLTWLALFQATIQLLRGAARSVTGLFALDSVSQISAPFYLIGTEGAMFLAAKRETPLVFFAYREVIYSLGRCVVGILLILVAESSQVWWIMWFAGFVGVILSLGLAFPVGRVKSAQ